MVRTLDSALAVVVSGPALGVEPRDDVISNLVPQDYTDEEILVECITCAAAGMVTTREFISMATWHLLEQPELRATYLAAEQAERYAILDEILRLEPVVGHLCTAGPPSPHPDLR